MWLNCYACYTAGATALMGSQLGFCIYVIKKNLNIIIILCLLDDQATLENAATAPCPPVRSH